MSTIHATGYTTVPGQIATCIPDSPRFGAATFMMTQRRSAASRRSIAEQHLAQESALKTDYGNGVTGKAVFEKIEELQKWLSTYIRKKRVEQYHQALSELQEKRDATRDLPFLKRMLSRIKLRFQKVPGPKLFDTADVLVDVQDIYKLFPKQDREAVKKTLEALREAGGLIYGSQSINLNYWGRVEPLTTSEMMRMYEEQQKRKDESNSIKD